MMNQLKKYLLIAVLAYTAGCATSDPARYIMRNCDVEFVGNCYIDCVNIGRWAEARGYDTHLVYSDAKYGRKIIKNGHVSLSVDGSDKLLSPVIGVGIVLIKKGDRE